MTHDGEVESKHTSTISFRDALRLADERIQRILTTLLLLSVIVAISEWKSFGGGWLARRYDAVRRITAQVATLPDDEANARVRRLSAGRLDSRADALTLLSELRSEIAKSREVGIPLLGTSVDVNDLGTVAGLVAVGLTLLLVFALLQIYEVQFLALQQVRLVHAREGRSDPNSEANALYHELLTAQVMWSPPSLARWDPSRIKHASIEFAILFPVLTLAWVGYRALQTVAIALTYGTTALILLPQYLVLVALGILAMTAVLYYRACRHRWSNTFFAINQQLWIVKPSNIWSMWRHRFGARTLFGRRLASQMISRLRLEEIRRDETIAVTASIDLPENRITDREISELCHRLEAAAVDAANLKFEHFGFMSAEVTQSAIRDRIWEVRSEFGVTNYAFRDTRPTRD